MYCVHVPRNIATYSLKMVINLYKILESQKLIPKAFLLQIWKLFLESLAMTFRYKS